MDDRTYGPSDGDMRFGSANSADSADAGDSRPRSRAGSASDLDFEALAKSLDAHQHAAVSVPLIIAGGVFVALTVLSFIYGWPVWATILCVVALLVVFLVGKLRRPPVAPIELTSSERDRVRRVLDEHGVRPAIALVRALYPGESSVAAAKSVRQLLERR